MKTAKARLLSDPDVTPLAEPTERTSGFRYRQPKLEERYELLDQVGRGGVSKVYKAQDKKTGRLVAIKAADVEKAESHGMDIDKLNTIFSNEIQALQLINSPGVVSLLDWGEGDCTPCYLVLEYVKGRTLDHDRMASGRTVMEHLDLFMKICDALSDIHNAGVIHRDIKPQNIIISKVGGKLKVTVIDLGLSRILGLKDPYAGLHVGTTSYLAPESLLSRPPKYDQRSDLYSFGAIMYGSLTGWPLADPENGVIALFDVYNKGHIPINHPDRNPYVPEALCRAVDKVLRPDPDERHQTAESLKEHLSRCMNWFE